MKKLKKKRESRQLIPPIEKFPDGRGIYRSLSRSLGAVAAIERAAKMLRQGKKVI